MSLQELRGQEHSHGIWRFDVNNRTSKAKENKSTGTRISIHRNHKWEDLSTWKQRQCFN